MNVSGAIGYDLAVPVDPASYQVEHDAAGVAYAFRLDEAARQAVAEAVRAELGTRATEVVALDVEPGYIRLRAEPGVRTPAEAFTGATRAAVSAYNAAEADHDAKALQLAGDRYVGAYTPENTRSPESFVDALDLDAYREADGFAETDEPVLEWTRENVADDAAGSDGRHVAHEIVVPVDPSTYTTPGGFATEGATFRWDVDADADERDPIEYTDQRVRRIIRQWGGATEAVLWPQHARVTVLSGNVVVSAYGLAREARRVLSSVTPPAVEFEKRAHVVPIDPDAGDTCDAWLDEHAPNVDGAPVNPEPADVEADDGGGLRGALSPFSGGA